MIVLDTHVLLWLDSGSEALGRGARSAIRSAWQNGQVSVSAITFWECAMLQQRARIHLAEQFDAWRLDLLARGLTELPVDGGTAILAAKLDMPQRDPADRIIAATAITHNATLFTADAELLRWRSTLKRQHAGR